MCESDEIDEKSRLELLRSSTEFAKEAIKACIVINAGAAAGLLVFMGNWASAGQQIRDFVGSLVWFVIGLIVAILAHGMAYASTWNFSQVPQKNIWKTYRKLAVVLTLVSLAMFAAGACSAVNGFTEMVKKRLTDRLELKEELKAQKNP